MIRALKRAKKDGFKIIYIDETVFTWSTVPRTEYCLQNRNVTVDKDWINEPTVAVLSGISRERGQELYMQFPKSVNVPKFKEDLTKLREKNGNTKVCIFMDNLSVHKAEESKKLMKQLKFRWIFNVPYAPDFNPIEFTFSKLK